MFQRKNIDFRKACRACLSENCHVRDITNTKIPKMMETCASIKVSENDGLPSNICISCFRLISKFFVFKKKMERTDRLLRYYLKQRKRVKQSDIINIALNDAEIEVEEHETRGEEVSDDDLPLSERLAKSSKELEVKQETIDICDNIVKYEGKPLTAMYSNDPPPLVPIVDKTPPVVNLSITEDKVEYLNLPKDTPPLIPIIKSSLLTSLESVPLDLKLPCNTCNEDFNSVTALKEHKLTSCQPNALQCNICQKEFKERKRLIGHLKGHMVRKDYCCKICYKRYPNPSTFKVHMRTHTGERPFKCQICNKGFVRWAGVVGHMRTHEPHKPHKCDTCGKGFKVLSNLERHKVLHTGSLPYCCNYCGKTFSQSENLQLHIKTYHTNERSYLCYECGKRFVSSNRLNRHMWVHTGYKPYTCQYCPKAYTNSNDLKNHERTHLGKDVNEDKLHVCNTCGMRFFQACRLSRHMKTHEKPYPCNYCSKKFSTIKLLNKHFDSKHSMHFLEEVIQEEEIFEHFE